MDEVLAVGDINFQKKCLGKMGDVAKAGRTVVVVSHQLNQIRRLCQRVVWIDGGEVRRNGNTHEVVSAYENAMASGDRDGIQQARGSGTKGRFVRWELVEPREEETHILRSLGPVTIQFMVELRQPVQKGHHGIALRNHDQQLIWAWAVDDFKLAVGNHDLRYTFPMLPLRPGPYSWQVSLYDEGRQVDAWDCLPEMIVATEIHQHPSDEWNGVLNMPSHFEVRGRD